MWVRSLGQEDPLEKEWQPTPVFLPGISYGQRNLAGYNPCGHRKSDIATEQQQKLFFYISSLPPSLLLLGYLLSLGCLF